MQYGNQIGGRKTERIQATSIQHPLILDAAADNPDVSMERIAEEVPSPSIDLIKQVLEKYGDPATESSKGAGGTNSDKRRHMVRTQLKARKPNRYPTIVTGPEYGLDTASEAAPSNSNSDTSSGSGEDRMPAALPKRQQELLRAIAARPSATQREIADHLGIAGPTVSNRVNSISEFEWNNRKTDRTVSDTSTRGHLEYDCRHGIL